MKAVEISFGFVLAVGFATAATLGFFEGGIGAAVVLVVNSLLATAIFALVGGRLRPVLAAIAVTPPVIAAVVANFSYARGKHGVPDALREVLPVAALAIGVLVLLPVFLVFLVWRFARSD